MSSFIDLMPRTLDAPRPDVARPESKAAGAERKRVRFAPAAWDLESFAEDQIKGLARQLYLTGSKPMRQVVFSAVDGRTEVTQLCRATAEALSEETPEQVCLVDLSLRKRPARREESESYLSPDLDQRGLREASLQVSPNLWFMSGHVFHGEHTKTISSSWVRSRLAELRLEFDCVVIQTPAAGDSNEALAIARQCDGMVLVLQADSTRRVCARKAIEQLRAAHVRLLGTVLTERTFPIPEAVYRRV
jgi:hypothetical protein